VKKILVTGMSGTGKSTVLLELARRGHRTVDTDSDDWSEWLEDDWIWREDRIAALLTQHSVGVLYVSGCKSNQGKFYKHFDAVVLLSAPVEVILARITTRDTNDYGKTSHEHNLILEHLATVEPLLRATCTAEIDATKPLSEVADGLEVIALGR
jgi:dephospho-CoA kinase